MQDFRSALFAAGLVPRSVVADGRIHRCPTKAKPGHRNGWYVLHDDGHGLWGDWSSGSGEPLGQWRSDSCAVVDHVAIARAARAAEEKRAFDRERRIAAIATAKEIWRASKPCLGHKYLSDKGLGLLGINHFRTWTGVVSHRVGEYGSGRDIYEDKQDDWLLVPMHWSGRIVSLQHISSDGRLKLNLAHGPTKGVYCTLDRPRASVTVLCEGPATGLAIYQSMRNARVIICFTAGNLLPVTQHLKPKGSVCFAADNDHGTQQRRGFNPGLDKARNAAELIDAGVAYPDGISGTDWADALAEWGQPGARRIERAILAQAKYVVGLPISTSAAIVRAREVSQ